MSIRAVIADDQQLMRSALRMCLEVQPDIEVIGEACDGRQAIDETLRLRPDVVLLDIRMPHVDGVEATRRIIAGSGARPVRVLVITGFDVEDYLLDALRAGASGFLVKDATAEEIVGAVRVIAAGDAVLAPPVTRLLLDRYARLLPRSRPRVDVGDRLTQRELTVLQLVARGWGNARIAQSLHLAPSSVKTHVSHLLAKVEVVDRVHLVIYAYESGLIQPGGADPEP